MSRGTLLNIEICVELSYSVHPNLPPFRVGGPSEDALMTPRRDNRLSPVK